MTPEDETLLLAELRRYGLPQNAGLSGLLRHLYANHAATIEGWKGVVEVLQDRVEELQARSQASDNVGGCGACVRCLENVPAGGSVGWLTVPMTRMIVCADCGNKRCPKATDHSLSCTGSNASGQDGSRYGPVDSRG